MSKLRRPTVGVGVRGGTEYTSVKSYPAKHSGTQYRQAQTRHSRQRLDKMEKTL
jgi:hypothetical protein